MYAWTNIAVIVLDENLGIRQWVMGNNAECSLIMCLFGIPLVGGVVHVCNWTRLWTESCALEC